MTALDLVSTNKVTTTQWTDLVKLRPDVVQNKVVKINNNIDIPFNLDRIIIQFQFLQTFRKYFIR